MSFIDYLRSWNLMNTETYMTMQGQFAPQDTTENINNNYATHTALSRQKPIVQFLNGEADTITFKARLYAGDVIFNSVNSDLSMLKSWAKIDSATGKPPVLFFWVGDSHIMMMDCVITSLGGIEYGRPTFFGGVRDVTLNISLLQYSPFSLEEFGLFETRYHRARIRDYYEMLTYREYGKPEIGDVIRKRHPKQPNLQVGNVVKLPSIEAIRKERTKQTSIPLQTAYGKKDTPQKQLRQNMFDARNRSYISHIIIED